jgi:uncharacterized secreted protein with C-terminal beta-propeller domain
VASTALPITEGGAQTESESSVTTFAERAGSLVPLGRVGGLGKGERVYAVRFVGDVGYVVTFRQVDPLYTVDLSVPSRPAVRGELKIRGYSAYLHPLGGGLLLGIGQDATGDGRIMGTQASLFDVSDLGQPRRIGSVVLSRGLSEVERDHHAFLWWPRAQTAVIPVTQHGEALFTGVVALRVRRAGIAEAGHVSHPPRDGVVPAIRRSLVVGDVLYTVSDTSVKASSLGTFADLGAAQLPRG